MDITIHVGLVILAFLCITSFVFVFTGTDTSTVQTEVVGDTYNLGGLILTISIILAIAGIGFITYAYFRNKSESYDKKWNNVFKSILDLTTPHEGINRLVLKIELAIIDKDTLTLHKYEGDLMPELLALNKCKELEGKISDYALLEVERKAIQSIIAYVKETEGTLAKQLDLEKEHLDLVSSRRNNKESYSVPLSLNTVSFDSTGQSDCFTNSTAKNSPTTDNSSDSSSDTNNSSCSNFQ